MLYLLQLGIYIFNHLTFRQMLKSEFICFYGVLYFASVVATIETVLTEDKDYYIPGL
jgi:hypothetical protein